MSRRNKKSNRVQRGLAGLLTAASKPAQVSADVPKPETLLQMDARLLREAEDARLAPIRKLEAENVRMLREIAETLTATVKTYWSKPLEQIARFGVTAGFVDLGLPTGQSQNVALTFKEFVAKLESQGIRLNDDAQKRLGSFVNVQQNRGVLINPESLSCIFDQLVASECFGDGVTVEQRGPLPEATPEKRLTLSDLAHESTESREGREKHIAVLNDAYFSGEAADIYQSWRAHLVKDYGFSPNEEQKHAVIQWFQDANRSYLQRKAWDECRVSMVRRGIFPSNLLTPDEQLAEQIETSSDISSRDARRTIALRQREIGLI
jgi:hypothetical protein